jgi:hypothetical protein
VYGCWLWTGRRDREGYGRTGAALAYHAVYAAEVGAVPPEHELDHCCRRRNCVAPHHLEPVKRRENERRKQWSYRIRRRRCARGHDLYERGRRTPEGGIVCRTCSGVE